ncbi:response regulator transcription factor [Spirosoma validum]|uniref:LytTR family transcriptional regulator DNA-binding domain-containing protein n=1 Tax=Spirosoma validum TaxID=2771355 RepID=A0A927B2T6_9BACT|nr:LytTR family transcriptional regulator DNA-binding domain-containing protein [Spirosoma validum]MBD2754334.1 LytTR family transcriptional regulator DNA-binding domain-containing protein [Spirosoma validum]
MSVIKPALQHPELIAYFSGANNYSWLYFRNGEKRLLAKPISYLETKLPDFIRVHKTILINPSYVKSLHQPPRQKMAGEIRLDSGEVFPVSRRRWQQVAEFLQDRLGPKKQEAEVASEKVNVAPPLLIAQQEEEKALSIIVSTEDEQNALLSKHAIEKKWPAYQVHTILHSNHLPDMLKQLPQPNYPSLLILDARTDTLERMNTVQRLKEDPQLGAIPVVLLVSPTDQSVTDGYKHQANSVISMPDGYMLFANIIERVCQFWLRTVALPGSGE